MTQPPADQEGVSKEELEIWAKSINPACSKLSRYALALLAERDALKLRAEVAEKGLNEARGLIQWLLDLQNGCPLPKYELDWNRIREESLAFLARHPSHKEGA